MNAWISVDDRLPDDGDMVLIFDWNWQEIIIGCHTTDDDGVEYWDADGVSDRVATHWMPLPEPPDQSEEK